MLQLTVHCPCLGIFVPSIHASHISRHVIGSSTLQSYTRKVHLTKISSIFAHGLLRGTFLKIKFPGVIIELLIWKGGGRPRNLHFAISPGTSDGEPGVGSSASGSAAGLLPG